MYRKRESQEGSLGASGVELAVCEAVPGDGGAVVAGESSWPPSGASMWMLDSK